MSAPTPPPTPTSALPSRQVLSTRLALAIGVFLAIVIGLIAGERIFAVVVAALAGFAAFDLAKRLNGSHPRRPDEALETDEPGAGTLEPTPVAVVVAGAVVTCLGAGWRLRGTLAIYLGLAVAMAIMAVWGMSRTDRPGLSSALGRSAAVIFVTGFGASHLVLMRREPSGTRLVVFLVVSVALYEAAATIFEAGTVQLRPGHNRPAPVAGAILCFLNGLIFSTVANPPLRPGSGVVIGVCIALAAAAGRALPAFFDSAMSEGGIEVGAVTGMLFVAAPVAYYVGRVVI